MITNLEVAMAALLTLFALCFFGKLATESYEEMADDLYEANWQLLPTRLQKHFIIMMANMQRPLYYHGLDVATLDLETFTQVSFFRSFFFQLMREKWKFMKMKMILSLQLIKTVYSYYMIFKDVTVN